MKLRKLQKTQVQDSPSQEAAVKTGASQQVEVPAGTAVEPPVESRPEAEQQKPDAASEQVVQTPPLPGQVENKQSLKKKGRKPKLKINFAKFAKPLLFTAIILVITAGVLYYINYSRLKAKRLAEEARIKEEELAKEKERNFIEEKRKEFDNLVSRIKECFENGNFSEAKEFFKRALAMHKEYGFPADEINEILQQIIIRENLIVLNELEKQSKDMFNFGYVRTRLRKIPNISVLAKKSARLKEESFKNEYLVCLYLAEQSAEQGLTGENNVINYYLGKIFLDNGIQCRKKYQVAAAYGKETLIAKKLNNLFFGTVDLKKNAFPEGLYEI